MSDCSEETASLDFLSEDEEDEEEFWEQLTMGSSGDGGSSCDCDTTDSEFRVHSCQWFYTHLQKRLNNFGSTKIIKSVGYNDATDSCTTQVREHIESLVESLVGKNLDEVKIIQLFDHPSYNKLFTEYHGRLKDSLALLSKAIYAVIRNEPVTSPELTPISAHTSLKQVVDSLVQHVIDDPSLNDIKQLLSPESVTISFQSPKASIKCPPSKSDGTRTSLVTSEFDGEDTLLTKNFEEMKTHNRQKYNSNQMYLAESYEDILSTAIINKVVTTKRRSTSSTTSNSNDSPNSPFKDEDGDTRANYNKDNNTLSRNNISGNGELPNRNTTISKDNQNHHKTNTNVSAVHDHSETWNRRIGTSHYNEDDTTGLIEPDIIPIKTQKLSSEVNDCEHETGQLLMSRESSTSPLPISFQQFQMHTRNDEEHGHFAHTGSSVSRMSESFTDTSHNRRTSSNSSASEEIQTPCTSDDQYDDTSHHDQTRYMMREEIEEVVTTEEYLNGTLEHEGKFSQLSDDKIEVSKVCKPKFTVTSYTIDPPVDRFRDSIYCLDTSVGPANSTVPCQSSFSPNKNYNNCDANLELNHSNETVKVPFPEFGVDLILATQTKCITRPDSDNINNENNNECKDEECQDASMNVNKDFTFSRHDNQEVNQNGIQNVDGTLTNSFEGNNKDLFADNNDLAQTTRIYLTDSGEWEDNWLFQKSRFNKNINNSSFMRPFIDDGISVCMLVPNPNKEADSRPSIGNVDIDLVSELSERISVASIDYSSSDSCESSTISGRSNNWEAQDDIDFPSIDGGQQNDLEHTEYSVLPHRRNSFTGIVSGGTIEREKVKRKQKQIVDSIAEMSTDVNREYLYFVQEPPPVTNAIEGNQVTFQCQIRGQKPIDVVWFRGSTWNLIEDIEQYDVEISQNKECHFITLFNVNVSHSGKYSCMAVNAKHEIWHEFVLNVKNYTNSSQKNTESSPKIESFYQIIKEKETEEMVTNNGNNVEQSTEQEFIIEEFDMTHFLCKISQGCFPEPRIIFYNKQGKRMQNNENIQIEKKTPTEWVLTFRRCSVKDEGCYFVKAINNIGSDTKNWKILVVATQPNILLDSFKALPGGNQFHCEKRKSIQSANHTVAKLVENKCAPLGIDKNLVIKPSQKACTNETSCNKLLDENSSIDDIYVKNMPLYPHSILKKPSMARVTSQPTYVQDEPLVDYDTDGHKHEETKRMDNKSSTPGGVKSGQSSSALLNEDTPLDRPLATPGSIADREHRKWTEKAIPFNNNPYTKESIERRLQRIGGEVNTSLGQKTVLGSDSSVDINNKEKSSTSGREHIVTSSGPRRIDCGLKSVDPALYRRDYYVNSNGKHQNSKVKSTDAASSTRSDGSSSNVSDDGNYSCSGGSSSNDDHSSSYLSSPEISRGLAYSNTNTAEPIKHQTFKKKEEPADKNLREFPKRIAEDRKSNYVQPSTKTDPSVDKSVFYSQKHSSNEKVSPIQGKYATKNRFAIRNTMRKNKEDDGINSSIEKLHDSLDDPTAVDSGLGSSSEYKSKVSKVETEVLRFQREIEKTANERSRIQDWERRKSSRSHNCSMDSLLSLDSDAGSTYNLNLKTPLKSGTTFKMPPKGKFSSTTSLLTNVQKQILLKNEESKWGGDHHRFSSSPSPPALPPKSSNTGSKQASLLKPSKESSHGDDKIDNKNKPNNNVPKRRVSISTDAVQIIGQSDSEEAYDSINTIPTTTTKVNNMRNGNTDAVPSIKQLPENNNQKKLLENKNGKIIQGRMSVPDVIPSHELTTDVCMQTQTEGIKKKIMTQNNNQPKDEIKKGRALFANKKDLEDLTEKGLPSVKDLVNRFMPNKTGMVKIRQSPEPTPRQSLLQKVNILKDVNSSEYIDDQQDHDQPIDSLEIHSLTARSVPRHFREGLKQNLPSPADKNIKLPQPSVKTVPVSEFNLYKKKLNNDSGSSNDGTQDDHQNYRRMKVTTSAWEKREEGNPKTSNEETLLNIIYDSNDAHQQQKVTYLDDETDRTSSPEHLGIPAGPVRMPLQRKSSIQNTKCSSNSGSKKSNDETFNDQPQKRDRSVKKQGGKISLLQESLINDSKVNVYTSDESCVDSIPPSRVRHPPPNRRKVTKSSANNSGLVYGGSDEFLDRQ